MQLLMHLDYSQNLKGKPTMSKKSSQKKPVKHSAPQKAAPSRQTPSRSGARKPAAKKQLLPVWAWVAIGVALVTVVVVLVLTNRQPATQQLPALPAEVSVQQAAQMQLDGAFMLDVREQSEWNEAHVPDSTLIPLGQLSARMGEVPKDKQVVIICRSDNRSGDARDMLLAAGYPSVTSVNGGINQWKAEGLPTVSGP